MSGKLMKENIIKIAAMSNFSCIGSFRNITNFPRNEKKSTKMMSTKFKDDLYQIHSKNMPESATHSEKITVKHLKCKSNFIVQQYWDFANHFGIQIDFFYLD